MLGDTQPVWGVLGAPGFHQRIARDCEPCEVMSAAISRLKLLRVMLEEQQLWCLDRNQFWLNLDEGGVLPRSES